VTTAERKAARAALRTRIDAWRRGLLGIREGQDTEWYWAAIRSQHPPFLAAVLADATVTARRRGERYQFRNRVDAAIQVIRLAIVTDAFLGQICYRAKARCQTHRIPLLPRVLHHLAVTHGGICIGDPVVIQPGVHIPHGQVVVNGGVSIARGVVLSPFTTLGLVSRAFGGPTIETMAAIGTGAKVLGPVTVGARAKVGANSVVLSDVPPGATVVGAPARVVASG
jgi:serine O-acetyltransferase